MSGRILNSLLRVLLRQRLVSAINIAGLSLGFAASLLIILFVRYEFSYESWIADSDSLFKIEWVWKEGGGQGQVPPAVIPLLSKQFPEIEETTRFHRLKSVVKSAGNTFVESVNLVDANFFNFFNVSMISGNRESITTSNAHVLVSESIAHKFFGTQTANALGNALARIQLGNDIDGEAAGDNSGQALAISSDGRRVAIGAGGNDGNGNRSGHVRVFEWSGNAWLQLGDDIDGEAAEDYFHKVSLSTDGNRVAIGAHANDGNGDSAGHVRVLSRRWSRNGKGM